MSCQSCQSWVRVRVRVRVRVMSIMSVNAVGYCQYQTYVPFAIFTMDGVCVQVGSGIVTGGMFCESLGLSNTNDEHSPSLFT